MVLHSSQHEKSHHILNSITSVVVVVMHFKSFGFTLCNYVAKEMVNCRKNHVMDYTGLFEMIVGVLTTCQLVLQMQSHVISFYGVTSRIRFMLLLLPQVSRN